jgi:hypothetical protein
MIAPVREIANVAAAEPAARLWAFAARLRRRHVRRAAEALVLRVGLLTAVPAIAAAWWWPAQRLVVLMVLLTVVLTAAAWAAWRARGIADAALLRGDTDVDPVGDELATWLEHHRGRRRDTAMLRWLGRDVDARLPHLPATALAAVGRRRLGRWRRLVPLVLLLLFVWLLAEWLRPPWAGLAGGGSGAGDLPRAGAGGGTGAPSGGTGGEAPPTPQPPDPSEPPPREPPPEPPPQAPSPPPPTPDAPTVEPEAPAPLLELPEQQRFVVPEFLGDGPSRRVRMHAAELEQRGGAPRQGATSTGCGNGDAPAPPPPTAATFDRAAEAAQRARHVPDAERPMVRRFFELLREAAK